MNLPSSVETTRPPGVPDDLPVAFLIGGRVPVRNRVLAAPMCGATKLPWRRILRRWGADVAYTEMVKAYPLVRHDPRTKELLQHAPDEAPCGPQICGGDPETMGQAAAVCEQLGFPLVDINMGCPVRRVVAEGAGAALLKDPKKVEAVTAACVRAVSIPVTVKIRSGWDGKGFSDAATLVRAAEAGGAALVTIHGRPRMQHHAGAVDLEAIALAKQAVRVPIVANGGVFSPEAGRHLVEATGCDAVMLGRGVYGRPWLVRDVARAIAGLEPLPPPSAEDVCDIMREHLEGMIELLGPIGVRLYRKYASWYFRDQPWGAHFRDRAYRLNEPAPMRALVEEWRDHVRACVAAAGRDEAAPVPAFVLADPVRAAAGPWAGQGQAAASDDDECD